MLLLFLLGSTLTIMYFLEMRIDKLAPPAVVQDIENAINNGELDRAFEVSTQEHCYFGQIMAGGLMMKDISYEQMITGMEHVAAEEGFKINARISNLLAHRERRTAPRSPRHGDGYDLVLPDHREARGSDAGRPRVGRVRVAR
jgi:hypothetical protein